MRILPALLVVFWGTVAQAQSAPSNPDPRMLAAQQAFETLSEGDRRSIQLDLTFATRFSGAASGNFGSLTFAAIQSFEKDRNLPVDGILSPQERQALAGFAAAERKALKFTLQDDRRTGARIGVPEAVLSRRSDMPAGGSRWQSIDGKVTLDTQVFTADDPLPVLFDKAIAPAASGRKVTYKLLRPDFFVVSGETAGGKFYRRVNLAPDGRMRGYALSYDKALEARMARLVIAIANTYDAFPQNAPASALAKPAPLALSAERLATGIVIEANTILTAALAVKDCRSIAVGPGKSIGRILAADASPGLALVRTEGLVSAGLTFGTVDPAQSLVMMAQSWSGALPVTQFGEATLSAGSGRVSAPLQIGGAGAALFDRHGALVGVIRDDPASRRQVAGIVPMARYAMVSSAEILPFLEKHGVRFARSTADAVLRSPVADRRAAIVPLYCTP